MIFVMKPLGLNTLEDFAQRVAKDLGLAEFHERESSSYANGHYFTGKLGISWLKVFECSDLGVQEFYGAIGINPPGKNSAHDIATSLAATGFQCMIPYETWIFEAGSQQGAKYGF